MKFSQNLIELISIGIIIIFLKTKTNINEKDLLTLVLINLFIFIVYDYLSVNKSCSQVESFNNSEPCNIKDIEKMFNKFISKKQENFTTENPADEEAAEEEEDLIEETIAKQLVENIDVAEDAVEDIVEDVDVIEDAVEDTVDTVTEVENILKEHTESKKKSSCSNNHMFSSWFKTDIDDDDFASYPNSIGTPKFNMPNYDNNIATCIDIEDDVPMNSTNKIKDLKKETPSEKKLRHKLWSCHKKLNQCK